MVALFLLVWIAVLAQARLQLPYFHDIRDGILRRFNVENVSVPRILELAEGHDLDVWHISGNVVDIYTSSFLPKELVNTPHAVVPLPPPIPNPVRTNTDWDVSSVQNSTFHDEYHPLDDVNLFMSQLVAAFPNITRLTNIGQTAEGRKMIGLTISSGAYVPQKEAGRNNQDVRKKKTRPPIHDGEKLGFVILGAQHAREWVATSTAVYLAHSVVVNGSEPNSLKKLLDHFNFYIIPVPNPDGYEYTWKTDRYWYKNRQIIGPDAKCVGLDMNRYIKIFTGYKWGSKVIGGSSNINATSTSQVPVDPCSHWYPGTRPFESYEVNNIANWIATLPNLIGFIDLRSYGQMLSSPFSYSCRRLSKDAEDQIEAALGATQALKSVYGTEYKVGDLCSTLYPAPGNVLDWVYVREGIKYSYVAHLRDTGTYGFSLPERWIRPTGEETSRLLDYLARFIAKQSKSNVSNCRQLVRF